MAKDDTIFVGANGAGRIKSLHLLADEERIITVDMRAYLGNKSTTATNVVFETGNDGVVDIEGASIASGVATVKLIAAAIGRTTVRALITLASGEEVARKFYVAVTDPQFGDLDGYQ